MIDEFLEDRDDINIEDIRHFQQWCMAIINKDHYREELSSQYFIVKKHKEIYETN
jgi:hypothetical protein